MKFRPRSTDLSVSVSMDQKKKSALMIASGQASIVRIDILNREQQFALHTCVNTFMYLYVLAIVLPLLLFNACICAVALMYTHMHACILEGRSILAELCCSEATEEAPS